MRFILLILFFNAVIIGFFLGFDPSIGGLSRHRAATKQTNALAKAVRPIAEPVRKGQSPL